MLICPLHDYPFGGLFTTSVKIGATEHNIPLTFCLTSKNKLLRSSQENHFHWLDTIVLSCVASIYKSLFNKTVMVCNPRYLHYTSAVYASKLWDQCQNVIRHRLIVIIPQRIQPINVKC